MEGLRNPAAWIDDKLGKASVNTADQVRTMMAEMQLLIQKESQRLDKLCVEATASLPHTIQDMDGLQSQLDLLLGIIEGQRVGRIGASGEVDSAFQRLAQMDLVLSRMTATRTCLREAEHWNTLSAEMEALSISLDYEKAAVRLAEARRSLVLLETSPSFNERKALLATLVAELIAKLSPLLVTAIAEKDMATIKRFSAIYAQLDQSSELRATYAKAVCEPIFLKWTEMHSELSKKPSLIKTVFSQITDLLEAEALHSSDEIVPTDALLEFVLRNMSPSFQAKIKAMGTAPSADTLAVVLKLHSSTNDFATGLLDKLLLKMDSNLPPCLKMLFNSFVHYQRHYYDICVNHLLAKIPTRKDSLDANILARLIVETSSSLFANCEQAVSQCQQFTFDISLESAVLAIDEYISAFAAQTSELNASLKSLLLQRRSFDSRGGQKQHQMVASEEMSRIENDFEDDSILKMAISVHSSTVSMGSRLDAFKDVVERAFERQSAFLKEGFDASANPSRAFVLWCLQNKTLDAPVMPSLDKRSELLLKATNAITGLVSKSQSLLYDCISARISQDLEQLPKMAVFSSNQDNISSPFNLELPQFSLSPSSYVTRIGEQLLTLPQQLDQFADDSSFSHSLATLPNLLLADTQEEMEATHVWITAISRGIEKKYMEAIVRIPVLSVQGRKQLSTDVNYLSNVLAAMEIPLQKPLQDILHFLDASDEILKKELTRSDLTDESRRVLQRILQIN